MIEPAPENSGDNSGDLIDRLDLPPGDADDIRNDFFMRGTAFVFLDAPGRGYRVDPDTIRPSRV